MTQIERAPLTQTLRERMSWSAESMHDINNADHGLLMDIDTFVDRLHEHRLGAVPITVHPDFDTDGVTAGITAWAGLAELGFDVELYVPDYRRGHDILPEAIDEMIDLHPRTRVVLSCDNMTNSTAGIRRAKERGLEVMVTDHHQELEPSEADFIVNPDRIAETYAHPAICGAHVIWQVLDRYCERYAPAQRPAIRRLRLFAGLGTIGDVMPVRYENRALVRDAVAISKLLYVPQSLSSGWKEPLPQPDTGPLWRMLISEPHDPRYAAAFIGFAMLLRAFQDSGKARNLREVDEGFFGFYAAPMLNAVRRMGGDLSVAFRLFTDPSPVTQYRAAMDLIAQNDERKSTTKQVFARLLQEEREGYQPLAPHVWLVHERTGMLGLVASELMRRTGLPVAVLKLPEHITPPEAVDDPSGFFGSARAPEWFPVISELGPLGFKAVGHEQACGVGANVGQTPRQLAQTFADAVQRLEDSGQTVTTGRSDLLISEVALPSEDVDASLGDALGQIQVAHLIEDHAPYGNGFPEPVIEVVVDLSQAEISTMGVGGGHVRITTQQNVQLIEWNAADRLPLLRSKAVSDDPVTRFLTKLRVNRFRGNATVQHIISDVIGL